MEHENEWTVLEECGSFGRVLERISHLGKELCFDCLLSNKRMC